MSKEVPRRVFKHPSWRVYRALEELSMDPADFGLRNDITIHFPYRKLDDLTQSLISTLSDPDYEDASFPIKECLELFADVQGRQIVEGLLLDGKPLGEVSSFIDAADNFILTYASLFFDTSVFSNRIEKLIYVREATMGEDKSSKNEVFDRGTEFFKARRKIPSDQLRVEKLVADATALAYMSMVQTSQDETTHPISQGWAKVFVQLVGQLTKSSGANISIKDFVVDLQSEDPGGKSFNDLK